MSEDKPYRGFASMSRERNREISSKGGKASHAAGTAHQFTPETAKIAGAKGGSSPKRKREQPPIEDPSSKGEAATEAPVE